MEEDNIRRERIVEIKCKVTPSHQSDLYDTLMCKFVLLPGKEDIVHGDYHYADYHIKYRESKKEPLTIINNFKIDIKKLLEEGGRIESMKNKVVFDLPTQTINKGTIKNVKFGQFPLFIGEFKKNKNGSIDINCYYDYKNMSKDYFKHKEEYPESIEYV